MNNKIKLHAINDNTIEVKISPNAPVELVEQLTKSLLNKGLVQDIKRSTVSTRYFYKEQNNVNKIADDLIKSLKSLIEDNKKNESKKETTAQIEKSTTINNNSLIKNSIDNENAIANKLLEMMIHKSILNPHRQPTSQEMIAIGEKMELGANQQSIKTQEEQWNNSINNWLIEAMKPISQRFSSEEEELEYWKSIKIEDRDDGLSGY